MEISKTAVTRGMRVLEKTVMPDGTEIVLEDWSSLNSEAYPELHGLTIGAYPVARNTTRHGWIEAGERFRLTISMNAYRDYTDADVRADFEALKAGTATLESLVHRFYNGEKDAWLLGMDVSDKGW